VRTPLLCLIASLSFLFSCVSVKNLSQVVIIDDKNIEKLIHNGNYEEAFKKAKILADRGFPEGYYYAGFLIVNGYVKEYSSKEGVDYLIKAYELGYRRAAISLGNFYYRRGNFPEAAKWFRLAYNYGYSGILFKKLESELKSGYPIDEEINELKRKAQTQPQIWKVLGDILTELGKTKEAIECYKKAYKYDYSVGFKLARLLIKAGKEKEAEGILKDLYFKGIEKAALELGKLYERKAKKLKLAVCPFTKAKTAKEYFLMLLTLEKERRVYWNAALRWYEASSNLPESQYRALRIKWLLSQKRCPDFQKLIYFSQQGVKEALYDLKRFLSENTCQMPQNLRKQAVLLTRSVPFSETFELNPGRIYYIQALKYLKQNEKIKAIELLKRACEFGYRNAEYKLAILLFDEKPELSAAVLFTYAKKGDPKAMYYLSRIYLTVGETDKYKEWLKESAKQGYLPAVKELVNLYFKEGKDKEALAILENYKTKKFCFAYTTLGEYYEEKLQLHLAEEVYKEGIRNNCQKSFLSLAQIYFLKGNYEKSLELLKAVPLKTRKVYTLLFKVFLQKKNFTEAAKYLKLAVKEGYVPSIGEMEKFKNFINWKVLYLNGNRRLKARVLMFYALRAKNFYKAFCATLKAAEYGEDFAPMYLINLAAREAAYSSKKASFVKRVSKNPKICDKFIQ